MQHVWIIEMKVGPNRWKAMMFSRTRDGARALKKMWFDSRNLKTRIRQYIDIEERVIDCTRPGVLDALRRKKRAVVKRRRTLSTLD